MKNKTLKLIPSISSIVIIIYLSIVIPNNDIQKTVIAKQEKITTFSNHAYTEVLKYVNDQGMVNYKALKKNPESLHKYLSLITNLDEAVYKTWSEPDKIAFWSNAYNAYTLLAILDHYPIKPNKLKQLKFPKNSIRHIPGVWDKLKFTIMHQDYTLNAMEHEVLRQQFYQPEIHMVLVCAAMSCPTLRNEPFEGEKLTEQFKDQTLLFVNDAKKFKIDQKKNIVYLSKIFEWYGQDFNKGFTPASGFKGHEDKIRSSLNYISQHLPPKEATYLKIGQYKVKFLDYDWTLNEQN